MALADERLADLRAKYETLAPCDRLIAGPFQRDGLALLDVCEDLQRENTFLRSEISHLIADLRVATQEGGHGESAFS